MALGYFLKLKFDHMQTSFMASFTPLSNPLGSVVSISVLSNSTECWG